MRRLKTGLPRISQKHGGPGHAVPRFSPSGQLFREEAQRLAGVSHQR